MGLYDIEKHDCRLDRLNGATLIQNPKDGYDCFSRFGGDFSFGVEVCCKECFHAIHLAREQLRRGMCGFDHHLQPIRHQALHGAVSKTLKRFEFHWIVCMEPKVKENPVGYLVVFWREECFPEVVG